MPTPIDEGHVDGIKNELLKRWSATELQKITKNLLSRCKTTIVGDAEVTPDVVVLHIKEVDEVIINATKAMSGNKGVAGIKKPVSMSNDHAELKRDLTMMIRLGHEEKYQQTLAKRKLRTGTLSKNEKLLEESLSLWIWWRDLPRAKFPLAPDEHAMNDGDATTAAKNIFIDAGRRRADRWRTYALEMRDTIPHEGWAWWPKGKVETIKPLITARIHDELPRYYSYDDDDEDSVRQILDAFPDSFADNILRTHLAGTLLDVPRVRQDLVSLAAQILESDSFWDDDDDSGDEGSSMGTGSRSSEVARSRINTNPDLSLSFDTNRGRSKSDMLDIPGRTTTSEKSSVKLKATNTGQVRKARVRIPEILAAGRTAPRPEQTSSSTTNHQSGLGSAPNEPIILSEPQEAADHRPINVGSSSQAQAAPPKAHVPATTEVSQDPASSTAAAPVVSEPKRKSRDDIESDQFKARTAAAEKRIEELERLIADREKRKKERAEKRKAKCEEKEARVRQLEALLAAENDSHSSSEED